MYELITAKGLGDGVWLRAIVLHLLKRGEQVTVYNQWRELFMDLPITLKSSRQINEARNMHYAGFSVRKDVPEQHKGRDGFELCCLRAGIEEPVELRMDWPVRNHRLLKAIKARAAGRPIMIYQPLKVPANAEQEILRPRQQAFTALVASYKDHFRIKLGHTPYVANNPELECELDMLNQGFICNTFDICTIGDLFVGEPCFLPATAEAMDKPSVWLFSRRALAHPSWLSHVNYERCTHKKHLSVAVYDE